MGYQYEECSHEINQYRFCVIILYYFELLGYYVTYYSKVINSISDLHPHKTISTKQFQGKYIDDIRIANNLFKIYLVCKPRVH